MMELKSKSISELISIRHDYFQQQCHLFYDINDLLVTKYSDNWDYVTNNILPTANEKCIKLQAKSQEIRNMIKHKLRLKYSMYPIVNHQLVSNKRYRQMVKLIKKQVGGYGNFKLMVQRSKSKIHFAQFIMFICDTDNSLWLGIQLNISSLDNKTNSKTPELKFDLKWKKFMFNFSFYDWALFLILFMVTNDLFKEPLNAHFSWMVTHKIFVKPIKDYDAKFQLAFDSIINTSLRLQKLFGNSEIYFTKDHARDNDLAMLFDVSQWIYIYLNDICGIILENRQNTPSYTYYPWEKPLVSIRDYNGNIFNSFRKYIIYRIRISYLNTIGNINNKRLIISKRVLFKYHLKYINYRLILNVNKEQEEQKNLWEYHLYKRRHQNIILPHRIKKLKKFKNKMKEKYRNRCFVCHRIEFYTMNELLANKGKYVYELKYCPCRKMLFCGKKCQKYAWKRFDHRRICSHKL
eukprot:361866_1